MHALAPRSLSKLRDSGRTLDNFGSNSANRSDSTYARHLQIKNQPGSRRGHRKAKRALLPGVAAPTSQSSFGTDLIVACQDGDKRLTVIRALLNSMPSSDEVHRVDDLGRTALWWACEKGAHRTVALLITASSMVNHADRASWTCLHAASSCGHAKVVNQLLEHGARVDDTTSFPRWTSLHLAASGGHPDVVGLLLDAGADTGALTSDGWTPLLLAAHSGHERAAFHLIEAGADVELSDPQDGETPLHKACRGGFEQLANVLLSHGATMCLDKAGVTPLAHALAWNFDWAVVVRPDAHIRHHRSEREEGALAELSDEHYELSQRPSSGDQ